MLSMRGVISTRAWSGDCGEECAVITGASGAYGELVGYVAWGGAAAA